MSNKEAAELCVQNQDDNAARVLRQISLRRNGDIEHTKFMMKLFTETLRPVRVEATEQMMDIGGNQAFVKVCVGTPFEAYLDQVAGQNQTVLSGDFSGWTEKDFGPAVALIAGLTELQIQLANLADTMQTNLSLAVTIYELKQQEAKDEDANVS